MKKLFLTLLAGFSAAAQLPAEIAVSGGKISGQVVNGIYTYKGIPYAAAPVNNLRWKAPQPVPPWQGTKPCVAFGPSAAQGNPEPFSMWSQEFLIPKQPISEDCLYLNVWSPASAATNKLPVMVWIHGGGFAGGGSAVPLYHGEHLAQKGIIVVTINYRVGLFGFFAHPELSKENPHNVSGNYGLLDQIAALQWVQKNIAAFGGDPYNVTIAGQSAGAWSVSYLVGSPLAKGLFTKAIAQSGSAFYKETPTLATAEKEGVALAQRLNATTAAQLRKCTTGQLLSAQGGTRAPVTDGYLITAPLQDTYVRNTQNPVQLLTGWNENEDLFWGAFKNPEGFKKLLAERYPAHAEKLAEYYPACCENEVEQAQLDLSRDELFGVPELGWIQQQTTTATAYVYRFSRIVPASGEYLKYRAFHSAELGYMFNNLDCADRPWEDGDYKLADTMSSYWANFVKTGNPNSAGLPQWPAYTPEKPQVLLLNLDVAAVPLPDKERLEFLQKVIKQKK